MNKLKTFWYVFSRSVTDPTYYNDILKAPISFSFKYLLLFYVFLAMISSVFFAFKHLPRFQSISREAVAVLDEEYPSDLKISVQDYSLSLEGANSPLIVPFVDIGLDNQIQDDYEALMAFDAESEETMDVPLHLSPESFTVRYPDDTKQQIPYEDLDVNFVIDRSLVDDFVSSFDQRLANVSQILLVGYFMFSGILYPIMMLVFLAILAAIVFAGTYFGERRLSYKKSYQMSIHALTFAETTRLIQEILFSSLSLPSVFTIAFFGAIFLGLMSLKPKSSKK